MCDISNGLDYRVTELEKAKATADSEAAHKTMRHDGEFLVRIRRAELNKTLEQAKHWGPNGARIKPLVRNGRVAGFRVVKLAANHPLSLMGFKDGDLVLAVDGLGIDGSEALSSMARKIREDQDIHFFLERDGQRRCLQVLISER